MEMTENMKNWLKELYEEAAKENHEDAVNCHIWAMSAEDNEEAHYFETIADEHRAFARILEELAKEIEEG